MRLRPESLRTRLALWYSVVLSLILLAFGLFVYLIVRLQLLRHHDAELVETSQGVKAVLAQHEDCEHLTPQQLDELNRYSKLVLFHAVDGDTRSFYRSPDLASRPFLRELTATPQFLSEPAGFKTYENPRGFVRVFTQPYRSHAGRQGLIRVMEGLGDVRLPLAQLRLALLILAPLAVAASSLGGYWLAGRALAPVDEITRLAREIEASQLSRRLPAPPVRDEIGRLVETLNQMIGRLEGSFEGMKRFTADASHELRSPLANLQGTVEVALGQPREGEEYRTALRSVGEEVERLRRIVEDLLVLARADARRLTLEREPVRLDVIAREVVESLGEKAAASGIAAAAGLRLLAEAERPVTVLGDERWLRQLVFNLVENAVKFTAAGMVRPDGPGDGASSAAMVRPDGPGDGASSAAASTAAAAVAGRDAEVRVQVTAELDGARLSVRDTGPGIPEEDLERVFERFYRADSARTPGPAGGFGLGLAIAAWIVKAHGGTISALRRPEGGTELLVRLPSTSGSLVEPPEGRSPASSPASP